MAAVGRLEDSYSWLKDEIDGMYIQLDGSADPVVTAGMRRGILSGPHRDADDFSRPRRGIEHADHDAAATSGLLQRRSRATALAAL